MTGEPKPAAAIWTRPARGTRGPAPEHSRAELAAAGVALADERGLAAVTMRSLAARVGTGPASLYRYLATRDELVALMADHVNGEFRYPRSRSGDPVADLLGLARQARGIYRRHPWLLEVPAAAALPGPNALAFVEHALAALAPAGLPGPARLETVGLFSGAVRLATQADLDRQRAGQDAAQWQQALGRYLVQVTADGRYPHLAAALADQPGPPDPDDARAGQEDSADLFDRAMTRILTGLLAAGVDRRDRPL